MERYPMLRLITRFSTAIVALVAIAAILLVLWFAASGADWKAIALAIAAGALAVVAAKTIAELIALVTEMLVPR